MKRWGGGGGRLVEGRGGGTVGKTWVADEGGWSKAGVTVSRC